MPGPDASKRHGFVFEVPAYATALVDPIPLTAMGRYSHEAAAVDPATGIVYLTEDTGDSLFYRFLPNTRGELGKGGRLQALALIEQAWRRHAQLVERAGRRSQPPHDAEPPVCRALDRHGRR